MKTIQHNEKLVSQKEFERICKKFPDVQPRNFQASGSKETFIVRWMDGAKKPYDLVRLYRAFY